MHIQEIEERDYEEGCRYTAHLAARLESLMCGYEPDLDEDGSYRAEIKSIQRQLDGEG